MTFRYRRLDADLDMTFGRGGLDFIVDTPEAVAQSIYTRMCLWQEEWYLNLSDGMPWLQQVLGQPPHAGADAAIRARIATTPYVTRLYDYASYYDSGQRTFTVSCKVITAFGQVITAPPGAEISPSGALVMSFGAPGLEQDVIAPPVRRLSDAR